MRVAASVIALVGAIGLTACASTNTADTGASAPIAAAEPAPPPPPAYLPPPPAYTPPPPPAPAYRGERG